MKILSRIVATDCVRRRYDKGTKTQDTDKPQTHQNMTPLTQQVTKVFPEELARKYFINYQNESFGSKCKKVAIVRTGNTYTTDHDQGGNLPLLFLIQVWHANRDFVYTNPNTLVKYDIRDPVMSWSSRSLKLTITAPIVCQTPNNVEQDIWQRMQ